MLKSPIRSPNRNKIKEKCVAIVITGYGKNHQLDRRGSLKKKRLSGSVLAAVPDVHLFSITVVSFNNDHSPLHLKNCFC